jgi:transposase-like protein
MCVKCPKCGSEETVKRGLSQTKNRGKQQRYLCRGCNKTFIVDAGFWKMKNKDEIVTMCVDMYLSNLSSRKMRNQLWRHFGIKVSHNTILNWVRKYVSKVEKYLSEIKPKLSGLIYADETEVRCQNRNDVFWCSVDWDTRFINATLYSPHDQNLRDAVAFLKKIKAIGKPKFIQTDGLLMYEAAIKKVFNGRFVKRKDKVEHKVINFLKTRKHNVRIETVFMKIKDRVNDFRGFKAVWSAPILMAGIVIQHNYIEKHSTTGKVPCELAGQDLNVGDNRWMGLIRMASTYL